MLSSINPIMLLQAISALVIRHKRVMSDRCVILCASAYYGYFHEELWPYTRPMYDMFQQDAMNTLPDMNRLGKYTGNSPNILALPRTFTTPSVHLCMKDPAQNASLDGLEGHPCMG